MLCKLSHPLLLQNQGIVLKARAAATSDKAVAEQAYAKYRASLEVRGLKEGLLLGR